MMLSTNETTTQREGRGRGRGRERNANDKSSMGKYISPDCLEDFPAEILGVIGINLYLWSVAEMPRGARMLFAILCFLLHRQY